MKDNYDNHWREEVPLMFQAQVGGRCQLQRVKKKQVDALDWAQEWTRTYQTPVKKQKPASSSSEPWRRGSAVPQREEANIPPSPPQFGEGVKQWEYTISWRLVSNSGQDETIIRPIIGAKGYPYFPGSSMKGAFRRGCETKEEGEKYCGKKLADGATEPGILRFHGGYPVDNSWTENIVDIIHPQQPGV